MDEEERKADASPAIKMEDGFRENVSAVKARRSASTSPNESKPSRSSSLSPGAKADNESTSTPENDPAPKLSRKSSSKAVSRTPLLFGHLQDVTEESMTSFQVIPDCLYGSKNMGSSEHDALDCDCAEEWRKSPKSSLRSCPLPYLGLGFLTSANRKWPQSRLRGRLRLYQSSDQDGVR